MQLTILFNRGSGEISVHEYCCSWNEMIMTLDKHLSMTHVCFIPLLCNSAPQLLPVTNIWTYIWLYESIYHSCRVSWPKKQKGTLVRIFNPLQPKFVLPCWMAVLWNFSGLILSKSETGLCQILILISFQSAFPELHDGTTSANLFWVLLHKDATRSSQRAINSMHWTTSLSLKKPHVAPSKRH